MPFSIHKKYIQFSLILFYSFVIAIGLANHELWMDESHHWLIARDASSIMELLSNYKYDGHPIIWVGILWLASAISKNVIVVKLIHWLVTLFLSYILIYKSPFKISLIIAILFSYLFIFEYAIISRNYALSAVFLFTFCYYWNAKKIWKPFLFLGLLANTHLIGLIISVIMCFFYVVNKSFSLKNDFKSVLPFIFLVFISFIVIKAPSDHYFYFSLEKLKDISLIKNVLALPFKTFIPLPNYSTIHLWNTNFFLVNFKSFYWVFCIIGWVIPLGIFYNSKRSLILTYSFLILLSLFCILTGLHISQRIAGFILLFVIALFWILNVNVKHTFNYSSKILRYLILPIAIIQIISGIILYQKNLTTPFSNTKRIANFLQENNLNDIPIYGGRYCNYIGISNYASFNLYVSDIDQPCTYCNWKIIGNYHSTSDVSLALEFMKRNKINQILFLSEKEVKELYNKVDFKLLKLFSGSVVRNENAYVYQMIKR